MSNPSPVPHKPPNDWTVFVLLDMQKDSLIAGYDALRGPGPAALRRTILVGVLITLASVKEAFRNACALEPALEHAVAPYKGDLDRWERMRHDVAHLFDRVFQPPRKNTNDPWIPAGFRIGAYDPATDMVQTGDNAAGQFRLYDAIETAFEACHAAEVCLYETQYGKDRLGHEPIESQIQQVRNRLQHER